MTLTVFRATKSIPTRSSLPPWAEGTNPWAQYMLLGMACVSLFACLIVFWAYWKGGHKRAEKTAIYYTVFSIFFFVFSLIMWIVGAAVYQHSKSSGNNKDMWGWSCAQNTREEIYSNTIDYALLCRLQVNPLLPPRVHKPWKANKQRRTGVLSAPSSKSSSRFLPS